MDDFRKLTGDLQKALDRPVPVPHGKIGPGMPSEVPVGGFPAPKAPDVPQSNVERLGAHSEGSLLPRGQFPTSTPAPLSSTGRFPEGGSTSPTSSSAGFPGAESAREGGEVLSLLKNIQESLKELKGGGRDRGGRFSQAGEAVFSWTNPVESPDAREGYPTSSPSVNVSSTGGIRGAGGWGFGSRIPGGDRATDKEFEEPGHRVPHPGGR